MNKRILSMLALPLIAMSGAWANGATEGYLPGKFSVSADKQVYFSKGNLQATTTDLGANWTWGFAEHQWDYVGKAAANNAINGNGTVSTNGTVDLFGWVGASNITWTGAAQYGITNSELFYGSNEGYGTGDYESLKSDWGNCIGQGWYTLSSAEWQYLLNYRNETRANKYGMGTVHGKFGLIILPDDYEAPSGISTTFVPGTTKTTYSDADWSKMEAAGAVFLPAAGRREGSSVSFTGSYGYYWTSSAAGQSYAYPLFFYSGGFNPAEESIVRYTGCLVRLVCEEISQGSTGDASDPEVTWDATNKQGTFTMPAGNVEVSVEYYQPAELAWKQGTAAVPEGGVSAYKGFPTTLPELANPNSHTVSYASTNTDVATIAADGKVTLVGAGTTTIQATFAGDDTYEDKTASYTLNVFLPATLTLKSSNDAWGTVTVEGASSGNNTIRWTRDVMDVDNTNYLGTGATFSALGITYTCTASESYEGLYTNDDQWEMEDGAYIMGAATLTSTVGKIAHIEIPYSENAFTPSDLAAGWSVSDYVLTWDGEPTETVVFTGGVAGIRSITYTLASEGESAITAIDNGNGTYSIIPGTEVTAKATPADGYHLDCWSNNAEVNDAGTQTFTMGEDDMELTAFFEDNTPTNVATFAAANVFTIEGGKAVVKVNADARPLNENQELTVKAGSTITIEAIPGYKIKSVKVKKGVSPNLPLTMEAITDGTIQVQSPREGMQYTLNGGEKKAVTADAIEVVAGDKVAFYGNGIQLKYYIGTKIVGGTAQVKLYGNIMSLVDEENFATATELIRLSTFMYLFLGNEQLIDASGLLLPATTLSNSCYNGLFQNCKNLTAIPELLPATTLTEECYSNMFLGCSSLTAIPEKLLPATVMAKKCYQGMFTNCSSLTAVPENLLPATVMANNCYQGMFQGCTSLTTIPEKLLPATVMANNCYQAMFTKCSSLTAVPEKLLPATVMADYCYYWMFGGCSSLTTVPENLLPASTLAEKCYGQMFISCTSLTTVPENLLPASTLASGCYYEMFSGCTSLTAAPVLPAETLVNSCYRSMFYNCSNLGSLTCLATSGLLSESCTDYWLRDAGTNVSGTKTFIAVSGVQWMSGTSGIPSGWTRVNYQP